MFFVIVLSIWALMHLYVFWRVGALPWVQSTMSWKWIIALGVVLWSSYPVSRILGSWGWHSIARPLELAAGNWVGTVFLLFALLLIVDVLTMGGLIAPVRGKAILGVTAASATLLAIVAMVIGVLPPVVREYEVSLKDLPAERDGMRVVAISDLHLGNVLRQSWCEDIAERVNRLRPDLLLVVGDLIDGNAARVAPMIPTLAQFQAPLGVFAVSGNHEYYAGLRDSLHVMESAGFKVLRDEAREVVPGLTVAGVDDLTARAQMGQGGTGNAVEKALQGVSGSVIYLSHSPLQVETAERLGAGLMLSGHTHNGQIWPFMHLVKLRYPHVYGQHQVGRMSLIIGAGTGTWGPRMRLWGRSEILALTLRRAA